MTLKRKLTIVLVVGSVLGGLAVGVRYRGRTTELVWYATPPLGMSRHRVHLLVPRGWKSDGGKTVANELRNSHSPAQYTDACVIITPGERSSWTIQWFGWMVIKPEEFSEISVSMVLKSAWMRRAPG